MIKILNMSRDYSYSITKAQYDYMLPVYMLMYGTKYFLHHVYAYKKDFYYFIGPYDEYLDMLQRCAYL